MFLETVLKLLEWFYDGYYISTLVVGLLVFATLRWWVLPHPRFPPGRRGLPLLGVAPFVSASPYKKVQEWAKSYGPIFSMKLFSQYSIFLMNYEIIQEAFAKSAMSDRPFIPVLYQVNKGKGIIDQNFNSAFKTHRRNGAKIFKGLGSVKVNMSEIVTAEGDYLVQHLRQSCGQPIDIKFALYHATGNTISQISLGKRFGHADKEFNSIVDGALSLTVDPKYTVKLMCLLLLPVLRYVPPFSDANRKFVRLNEQIFDFIQKEIDCHVETLDPSNVRDFIDMYLADSLSSKNKTSVDPETNSQLIGFVKDLFFAGIETTAIIITWAVHSLLTFPEVYNKLKNELDSVVGPHESISIGHKDSLPYTCAFIQEVMRFHTLVPLGVPHITGADVELSGYVIPKNTVVQGSIWSVHNDPETWPEPDKFDPKRHLDDSGRFVPSKKVIPFSIGIRRCIGESLARMEVFVFVATLIKHFDISLAPGSVLPAKEKGSLGFIYSPLPFKVVLKERE